MGRRLLVRHIKRNGAHLLAKPLDQIGELLRIARRCNELVSRSEYRFGKRTSKATRTTCNQPYLWHRNLLLQVVLSRKREETFSAADL
jgi:hypothetical protein